MKFNRKTCLLFPVLSLVLLLSLTCLGFYILRIIIPDFWCRILVNQGGNFYQRSRYDEGLAQYQAALICYQQVNNRAGEGTTLNNIGEVYRTLGRYDEALDSFQQALTIRREVDDHSGEGITLNNIGGVYYSRGRYDEALEFFQQALDISHEMSDRAGEGRSFNNIGEIYLLRGHYDEALGYYQQALVIYKELGIRAGEATIFNNIGRVYQRQGRYDEALDSFQQAFIISSEVGDRIGQGNGLNSIGDVYHSHGRYDEALDSFQQALAIYKEVGIRIGESITLNNIGGVYQSQGHYDEALDYFQQALAIQREVGDRAGEGITLNNIAGVYDQQGYYDEALNYYQQALAIHHEVSNRTEEGMALNNIGGVYQSQGHYDEALDYFQQALAIQREVGDRAGEGKTLNNFGAVHHNLGRYDKTLEYFQQALAIRRDISDRSGEATTLNNIGAVYDDQGRYDESLKYYQQALTISREIGDQVSEEGGLINIGGLYAKQGHYDKALNHLEQALAIIHAIGNQAAESRTLNNIGVVYDDQGRYDESLKYYQQALTISREIGDQAMEGTTLNNIGNVFRNQKTYDEALDYFKQALAIQHKVGDRVGEVIIISNIGWTNERLAHNKQAIATYQQAIDIMETVRATAGSEQGRASFIAQYANLYDWSVTLYHQQDQDEESFLTAERGRARTFLDGLATGQVQLSDNAATGLLAQEQEAYAQRQAIRDALAKAKAAHSPDPAQLADLEQQLAQLEQAYAEVQAAIQARGDQLADLVPGRSKNVLDVAQAQALLDDQTTLLAYYVLDDQTLAFVLTAKNFQVVELPVSRADLTSDVTDFRKFSDTPSGETTRRRAEELYQTLIAPLAGSLQTSHLIIVPHQVLHYLPFAALYDAQAGQYLVEKYTLSTLPSASALKFVTANEKKQAVESPRVPALVIGNPKVGQKLDLAIPLPPEAEVGQRGDLVSFPSLPFAKAEAEEIAALYGVEPLVSQAASEAALRQQVAGAGLLHLAAHGYYNPDTPLSSLIALAPDDNYDGWLTAGEVYGLDLKQTNLVVLSACQTQLGQLREGAGSVSRGDDVVSLTRAFMFAGTPTVVASLWSINDAATGQLMTQFYGNLKSGMGKAEALRQAQLALLKEPATTDPYFWAAFVLSGDGGR